MIIGGRYWRVLSERKGMIGFVLEKDYFGCKVDSGVEEGEIEVGS